MTATLTIVLFFLAVLIILLLAMPMAVVLYWMEETFPGLLENLKFWVVLIVFVVAAITLFMYLPAVLFL